MSRARLLPGGRSGCYSSSLTEVHSVGAVSSSTQQRLQSEAARRADARAVPWPPDECQAVQKGVAAL
eukprot:scaffold1291_cov412-Prasinococcus_capsulatus_cf.AAC.13